MILSLVAAFSFWSGCMTAIALVARRDGHEYRSFLLIGGCSLLGAVVVGWLQQ